MASPYTSQSASGYNSTPPADDGSAVASNQVLWSTIKTKLSDPAKNLADSINSAVSTAVGKLSGGASTSTQSTNYQVLSADQGKLIIATVSGITVTTPDATSVGSPFQFRVLNNSSDTITVDGNGAQTIDGAANVVVAAGAGVTLDTDGSNWYTNGTQGTLVGKQIGYGEIINGTITESNGSNAVTYSLKTLAGATPSASDPVLLAFRNVTAATGNYVYRTVTAALTLTISSGSTLATTNAVPFKVWLVVFDDGGTLRMGAINCRSTTSIYPLGQFPIASSTAEGGAGAADSAHVFYTGTAVTSKAYLPLGYCSYESGMATAGAWTASPTRIQLYGQGIKLPGDVIQIQRNDTGTMTTGTTAVPFDNTTPLITEGDEYMSQAITPTSTTNILDVEHKGVYGQSNSTHLTTVLVQDTTITKVTTIYAAAATITASLNHRQVAATTSATTFKIRAGGATGATTTFNGNAATGLFNGLCSSFLAVTEIMT